MEEIKEIIPFKKDKKYTGIHLDGRKENLNKESYSILLIDQKMTYYIERHYVLQRFNITMIEVLLKSVHIFNLTTIKNVYGIFQIKVDSVVQSGRIICKNKPQMN